MMGTDKLYRFQCGWVCRWLGVPRCGTRGFPSNYLRCRSLHLADMMIDGSILCGICEVDLRSGTGRSALELTLKRLRNSFPVRSFVQKVLDIPPKIRGSRCLADASKHRVPSAHFDGVRSPERVGS